MRLPEGPCKGTGAPAALVRSRFARVSATQQTVKTPRDQGQSRETLTKEPRDWEAISQ